MPEIPYNKARYTHNLHSYPAKLIPQIPALFLEGLNLSPSATILDPFCGSGTVLLESIVRGFRVIGIDSNPLARMISKAKVTRIPLANIESAIENLPKLVRRYRRKSIPDVVNLEYWYSQSTINELAKVRHAVENVQDEGIQRLLWVALSQAARKLSNCDLRVSVPVVLNPSRYKPGHCLRENARERQKWVKSVNVREFYIKTALETLELAKTLSTVTRKFGLLEDILNNAHEDTGDSIHGIKTGSVDLIITSPPYAGAQKYIRASTFGLGWIGLCKSDELRTLEKQNVGREHFSKTEIGDMPSLGLPSLDEFVGKVKKKNPLRAKILNCYLHEMERVFKQCKRVLHKSGLMVLVAGPNKVCGMHCDTPGALIELARRSGLVPTLEMVDEIHSRGLMTRRNKTAGVIEAEHIYLLKHV